MNNKEIDIKKIVGKNIKKYRKLKNLTQEKLAELLNVEVSTLSNLETGKSFPNQENLRKIIDILGIELEMLFTDKDINNLEFAQKDFEKRYELIKNNEEKFNILYNMLKILS